MTDSMFSEISKTPTEEGGTLMLLQEDVFIEE